MAPGPIRQNVQEENFGVNIIPELNNFVIEEREPETNLIIVFYHKIAKSNYIALAAFIIGWSVRAIMI